MHNTAGTYLDLKSTADETKQRKIDRSEMIIGICHYTSMYGSSFEDDSVD